MMTEKEIFIERLKKRTRKFAVEYDREELMRLIKEANEIIKIMSKAKNSTYSKK